VIAAWTCGVSIAVLSILRLLIQPEVGFDTHAYWLAGRAAHPYGAMPGARDAFLYSPAFVQLMRPLALLPWVLFAAAWMLAVVLAFFWLTAPLAWRWRIPVLLACLPEVVLGNVYAFLALAAVLGLRRPQFWAIPLLTKVTPGLLGLVWFAARGEWRNLARVLSATTAVIMVSYLLDPELWREWVLFLTAARADDTSFLVARVAIAATAVVVAARVDQAWVLPAAMWLGASHFSADGRDLSLFTGTVRLSSSHRAGRRNPS
jgi:hypothetical protein